EPSRIRQIADPDATSRDFVLVSRPDAARGRPDLAFAASCFRKDVEVAVIRQDQMRFVADDEAAIDVDTVARQLVDLREQRMRIDHNAVANDADDARMQDAGGNQPKDELRSRYENRVAGIVAALVTRDEVEPRRQQIDDLSLTFVTPLGAEHSEIHISVNV